LAARGHVVNQPLQPIMHDHLSASLRCLLSIVIPGWCSAVTDSSALSLSHFLSLCVLAAIIAPAYYSPAPARPPPRFLTPFCSCCS
jgi:hypothetical protein